MELLIKDPRNDNEVRLEIEPEDYNGEQGVRVVFPDKDSFVMVYRDDNWEVVDEEFVNPELVDIIGKGLHPRARYTHNSHAT